MDGEFSWKTRVNLMIWGENPVFLETPLWLSLYADWGPFVLDANRERRILIGDLKKQKKTSRFTRPPDCRPIMDQSSGDVSWETAYFLNMAQGQEKWSNGNDLTPVTSTNSKKTQSSVISGIKKKVSFARNFPMFPMFHVTRIPINHSFSSSSYTQLPSSHVEERVERRFNYN